MIRAFSALKWDAESRINEQWSQRIEMTDDELAEALGPHLPPSTRRERPRATD